MKQNSCIHAILKLKGKIFIYQNEQWPNVISIRKILNNCKQCTQGNDEMFASDANTLMQTHFVGEKINRNLEFVESFFMCSTRKQAVRFS